MSFKKRFKINTTGVLSPISGANQSNQTNRSSPNIDFGYRNWGAHLPDVYTGHPNRIERYTQYESMDMDPEINSALDTIAEFCTQDAMDLEISVSPYFHEKASTSESNIIKDQLKKWYNLQDFDLRLPKLFRNVCKYGDQIMIRDPETFELYWSDVNNVTKIVVNESEGKVPESYFIKDIDPNFENLTATGGSKSDTVMRTPQGSQNNYSGPATAFTSGTRFTTDAGETEVSAEHIVHFSLTEGLDQNWPFGVSLLETSFKTYKQKEMLEDAILIYRVQRAPERRVFYIDVGGMPTHLAMQFVERVKNEIHQRRIPTQTGGGNNIMDATYNPLSTNEDFFFPQTSEGRGSKVETLPGGENLGQIDDLKYFNNKLLRGLRVPSSYLPSGPEDGTQSYSDGRVTTALIQEYRFNQYCKRLQKMVQSTLDKEFKIFLAWRGFNIDNSLFELRLSEPMNFASYREIELFSSQIGNFSSIEGTPYLSKRFVLKKYLGLSDLEITENETMLLEESGKDKSGNIEGDELRNIGVSTGDINNDMEMFDEIESDGDDNEFGELDPGEGDVGEPSSVDTSAPTTDGLPGT